MDMTTEGITWADEIRQNKYMGKWVPEIKGKANESYEISVLRDDNAHGKRSYGWPGQSKIIISSNGGPCGITVPELVWNRLLRVARETADELNQMEESSPGFRFVGLESWYSPSRDYDAGRTPEQTKVILDARSIADAKRVAEITNTAKEYGEAHPAPPEFWDK